MRYLIAAIMVVCMMAFMAQATPPPAHGGYQAGWGMQPFTWDAVGGSWSAWGLYDYQNGPDPNSGGDDWVVDWTDPNSPVYISYDPITLELWIEQYCYSTYEYTSYQWHRLGDQAETVHFIIQGIMQSNNGQWMSLVAGTDPMTHLIFRHDALGRTGATYGGDIPITWEGRWGTGLVYGNSIVQQWTTYTPDPDVDMLIPEPCDHWFQFRGTFVLYYHIDDGYYSLEMAGCPAPEM